MEQIRLDNEAKPMVTVSLLVRVMLPQQGWNQAKQNGTTSNNAGWGSWPLLGLLKAMDHKFSHTFNPRRVINSRFSIRGDSHINQGNG